MHRPCMRHSAIELQQHTRWSREDAPLRVRAYLDAHGLEAASLMEIICAPYGIKTEDDLYPISVASACRAASSSTCVDT